jgi:hypothetical protein
MDHVSLSVLKTEWMRLLSWEDQCFPQLEGDVISIERRRDPSRVF